MRTEALYFAGVAAFFAVISVPYLLYAQDPAGSAIVVIAVLMASLVAFFLGTQYRRRGKRPEDRREGEIAERAGPLDFFPPHSPWPVITAAGFTVLALGVVYGLWLLLIGFVVLAAGVFGFAFQYPDGTDRPG
ncbi:cytochrome c oxidase subunit 4 [Streptomyces sp. TRM 70351]|uniref:aa3-type cytochrome oxidase subunit IV n=1 Tax=Streptomyces sp. TRM 70351 TaxID=3116552 RepID=UPI002E7AC141|nr:cytochrome c oxidase subunit 4 [Streptomyces sp. TRM 70351]MEE1928974.1 cytochrome c oxidase subunit 4 [Streptomyces sp. TRM 70351]